MRITLVTLFCILSLYSCAGPVSLHQVPIYIEDYHTGSFYRLAAELDWDGEYEIILFDAHSDARAVYQSRLLREDLIRARKEGRLSEFLAGVREHNVIQCFNWLEPLLPRPLSRVTWVFPRPVDSRLQAVLRAQVKRELCARGQAEGDEPCTLAEAFLITDFKQLAESYSGGRPIVVSIDLDYFALMTAAAAEKELTAVLDFSLKLANLKIVTVAISNVYLQNEAQGHHLLFLLLRHLMETGESKVFFEPFARYGQDLSREAGEFARQGRKIPVYDIEQAPDCLRELVCNCRQRIIVRQDNERWQSLLDRWQAEQAAGK